MATKYSDKVARVRNPGTALYHIALNPNGSKPEDVTLCGYERKGLPAYWYVTQFMKAIEIIINPNIDGDPTCLVCRERLAGVLHETTPS